MLPLTYRKAYVRVVSSVMGWISDLCTGSRFGDLELPSSFHDRVEFDVVR